MSLKFGRIADRDRTFLAVDPGVKYFAWAYVKDGRLVRVGLDEDNRYLANRFPAVETCVVERARVHRGAEKKKGEVEGLLIMAGEVAGQFPKRVYGLQTLPKEIFNKRTRDALWPEELLLVDGLLKKDYKHIIDAVGYAMKYLGRI